MLVDDKLNHFLYALLVPQHGRKTEFLDLAIADHESYLEVFLLNDLLMRLPRNNEKAIDKFGIYIKEDEDGDYEHTLAVINMILHAPLQAIPKEYLLEENFSNVPLSVKLQGNPFALEVANKGCDNTLLHMIKKDGQYYIDQTIARLSPFAYDIGVLHQLKAKAKPQRRNVVFDILRSM